MSFSRPFIERPIGTTLLVIGLFLVRAVAYLGSATKFVVALDAGGELTVLQQNLETSSEDVHGMEGKRVRLSWRRDVEFAIDEEGT